MKTFRWIGVLIFSLLLLVGCTNNSGKNQQSGSKVSFDTAVAEIKEQMEADMKANGAGEEIKVSDSYVNINVKEADESDPLTGMFLDKLQLNEDELENGVILAAMMNINSDEIILLEATDESHVESLKKALETEKEAQVQTWSQYLPDQYEKVKNNVLKTNGKYLLYVTYENPDKIEEIFDKQFQ